MKVRFEIEEFDKETLADLFETAWVGNDSRFDYDLTEQASEVAEGEYTNERVADALLKGKAVKIYDNTCYEDGYDKDDELPYYGTEGTNWVRKFKHKLEYDGVDGYSHTCYVPGYEITIETLIKGFNASSDSSKADLLKMLIEGNFEGDTWDAYNFFQIAVFGEIVYG